MNTILNTYKASLVKTLSLSISLIIASTILGGYLYKSRQPTRNVSVRGLAEREVSANIGIWPIRFRIADNDLMTLQKKTEKQYHIVNDFLFKLGIKPEEISYGVPLIDNADTETYSSKDRLYKYVKTLTVTVRSENVAALEKGLQKSEELAEQGVILTGDRWDDRYRFLFTELNKLKPEMIQQATIEARKAAEQFAKDSGSKIGNIKHATQGNFSIEDTHLPTKKNVRVVTTIEYELVG